MASADGPPDPKALREATSPSSIFSRQREIQIAGVRFRIRRLTLLEELEWYGERERIIAEDGVSQSEKVVRIWESLLRRVVVEPVCRQYTEELPAPVIARLIENIFELHLWNMDFPISRLGSSSTSPSNTTS